MEIQYVLVSFACLIVLGEFPCSTRFVSLLADSRSCRCLQNSKKKEFPKMGVPLKIIHFNRMFPYKPSIFGYLHLWKPPNGSHVSESQPIFFLISQPCTHNPLPCFKMPENLGTPQEKHINPAFYLTGHRVTNHNIYVI